MSVPKTVLFLHGLESGPNSSKSRALVCAGHHVIAPDCRGLSLRERIEIVVPILREFRPYIVGSSYGGITAVKYRSARNDLPLIRQRGSVH